MLTREAELSAAPLIRVGVCDDNAHFLAAVTALITGQPDFELVGVALEGAEAVQLAGREHPDVLVLDIQMPVMNGLKALPQIQAVSPATRTILFTADAVHRMREWGLHAGAGAVLDKFGPVEELLATIRRLAADRGRRLYGQPTPTASGWRVGPPP